MQYTKGVNGTFDHEYFTEINKNGLNNKIMNDRNELLKIYAKTLWEEHAIRIEEKPFTLKSGGESHIYLEHRGFVSKYSNLRLVSHLFESIILDYIENYTLCSVDSIASPIIVGSIASLFNHNLILINKNLISSGLKKSIFGDINYPVVLIDDVTSTGSTLIETTTILQNNNIETKFAAVLATRNVDPIVELKKIGVTLIRSCSYAHLVKLLWTELTPKQQKMIETELELSNM
jgi:orotate phosphoribosyltransferase